MPEAILLQVEDLVKKYSDITAVNHVSFQIRRGESVGLVGESGCGKSTLARLISGLEKPSSGKVQIDGAPYRLSNRQKSSRLNMVFQNPADSFDSHMSVFSSLYEALSHSRKISQKEAIPIVEDALEMVELPGSYAKRRTFQLSGGECQRIGIARAMITDPDLLILDEATSALDVSVQAQIIHLLQKIRDERQYTYFFIAHDLGLVATMCERVLVMYKGSIVEEGASEAVMKRPLHPYTKLLVECAKAFAMEHGATTGILPKVPEIQDAESRCCPYAQYCPKCTRRCGQETPEIRTLERGHRVACHLAE